MRIPAVLTALVLTTTLVMSGLFPGISAAADFDVTITPSSYKGATAVRGGHEITISGNAPAGEITTAQLVGRRPDGSEVVENALGLNAASASDSFIRNDNGTLSGRQTLNCTFDAPNYCRSGDLDSMYLRLEIAGANGSSNQLPVDYTRPQLLGYRLTATNKVQAVFSEAVRLPSDQLDDSIMSESPLDWELETAEDNKLVTGVRTVAGAPHVRELDITTVGEDDTPLVSYRAFSGRPTYVDAANNQLGYVPQQSSNADDRIRPPAPSITQINGSAPQNARVTSNNATPTMRVGNLKVGHEVIVSITYPDGTTETWEPIGADATEVPINLPTLSSGNTNGRDFIFTVVAQDAAGNRSDQNKNAARADGSPSRVTYVLDDLAPTILSATQVADKKVEVTFSDAVVPAGNAGSWTVGGQSATATGEGAKRVLTTSGSITQGATVSWAPSGDSRYRDDAGNAVPGRQGVAIDLLPALPAPTVTSPKATLFISDAAASYPVKISGSAPVADAVEVSEPGRSRTIGTAQPNDADVWTLAVGKDKLPLDGRYSLRAVSTHASSERRSGTTVIPDIVVDTAEPFATVHQPSQQPPPVGGTDTRRQYLIGEPITVSYSAHDPAPTDPADNDHGVRTIISVVGEGTRRVLSADAAFGQDKSFTYRVAAGDLAGQDAREVQFEVVAVDAAGNRSTPRLSAPVRLLKPIDPVTYTPIRLCCSTDPGTENRAYIDVRFPVEMEGLDKTNRLDWRINGATPLLARRLNDYAVRLTLVPSDADFDPNLKPSVSYAPTSEATMAYATTDNGGTRHIVRTDRQASDGIRPVLFATPSARGPLNETAVTISGTSDKSSLVNRISIYKVNTKSQYIRGTWQSLRTNAEGKFSIPSSLLRNQVNHFRVKAIDPNGNESVVRAFTVNHDSTKPVVTITAPKHGAKVSRERVYLTWGVTDRNFETLRISYRVNDKRFYHLVHRTKAKGTLLWNPWNERVKVGDRLDVRIVALDRAGNWGQRWTVNLVVGR